MILYNVLLIEDNPTDYSDISNALTSAKNAVDIELINFPRTEEFDWSHFPHFIRANVPDIVIVDWELFWKDKVAKNGDTVVSVILKELASEPVFFIFTSENHRAEFLNVIDSFNQTDNSTRVGYDFFKKTDLYDPSEKLNNFLKSVILRVKALNPSILFKRVSMYPNIEDDLRVELFRKNDETDFEETQFMGRNIMAVFINTEKPVYISVMVKTVDSIELMLIHAPHNKYKKSELLNEFLENGIILKDSVGVLWNSSYWNIEKDPACLSLKRPFRVQAGEMKNRIEHELNIAEKSGKHRHPFYKHFKKLHFGSSSISRM